MKQENHFIEENDLMSKKHKNVLKLLNYIAQSLILVSAVTGCVLISAFASLSGIAIGIASSAVRFKKYSIAQELKCISQ